MNETETTKTRPPISTLTPEERALRYEELRRRASISKIFAECKDPNIAVRWVRKDDGYDIALHQYFGFKIAKEPMPKASKDKRRFNTAIEVRDDGTYVLGDVILMEADRDEYEFYCNEAYELSQKLMSTGQKVFISEAAKLDVPTFVRDKSGRIIS